MLKSIPLAKHGAQARRQRMKHKKENKMNKSIEEKVNEVNRSIREDRINIGDKIDVHFVTSNSLFNVTVLFVPTLMGESWIIKTNDNHIHYVQYFETIEKLKGGLDEP